MMAELASMFVMSIEQAQAALEAMTPERAEAIMFEAADTEPYTEHVESIRNLAAERAGWGGLNLGRPGTAERARAYEVKRRHDELAEGGDA